MRATLLVAAALAAPLSAASSQPPNVVLIIGDDQAWGDFSCMGHDTISTPHIDSLAEQSAFFPNGYVPSSLCRPSLATIITGLYPHQHAITGNDPPRGSDRRKMAERIRTLPTLPRLLARRGYRSFQTGKWWEGSPADGGFTGGMTHGDPSRGGRHGDVGLKIGRDGLAPIREFLDGVDSAPFFLWYAPFLPHTPHNPPKRLLAKYRGKVESVHVAKYYAMCEWFDETVGELLGEIDKRGLRDDTIVLFVTDNGWIQRANANGFAPRSKRSPYEGGVRTPIMVRWPEHVRPGRHELLASSIDLAPTVLTACGVEVPKGLPGTDLVILARGDAHRDAVFGETFTHDVAALDDPTRGLQARWIRAGDWKLIQPATLGAEPELFDLGRDPHERRNLAAEQSERVGDLQRRLDRWWKPGAGRDPRPNVLFVLTDDQCNDRMGCAGHPILKTPTIDRLAAGRRRYVRRCRVPKPPNVDAAFFDGFPKFVRGSLNRVRWHWRFDTEQKRVEMTRGYYRMISGVDRAVGRVLAELERIGLRDPV